MEQLKELQAIHNIITAVFIISIPGLFFETTRIASALFIILVGLSNVVFNGCIMTKAEDRLRKIFRLKSRRLPFLNTFIQQYLRLKISVPKTSINLLMAACAFLAILQLVSASNLYLLTEGENLTINVNETHQVLVEVKQVSDSGAVIFLNGENAGIAKEDQWLTYSDGSQIFLQNLFISEGALDKVEIYVFAKNAIVKPELTLHSIIETNKSESSVNESNNESNPKAENNQEDEIIESPNPSNSWWTKLIRVITSLFN